MPGLNSEGLWAVSGKWFCAAHSAFQRARYVFNPSAPAGVCRSPGTPLVDFDLPVGLLNEHVQLTDLLRQVVRLLLQLGDGDRRYPLDFLHAVTIRLLTASLDRSLQDRMPPD